MRSSTIARRRKSPYGTDSKLLGGAPLVELRAGRALADALAVEAGVDGRHHVAAPRQRRADQLLVFLVGADALLGAAVAMKGEDRRGRSLAFLRDEDHARH